MPLLSQVTHLLGGAAVLGHRPGDWQDLVRVVRERLPFSAFVSTTEKLHLSQVEAAEALGLATRTLYRRRQDDARFQVFESEKVLRLARIGAHALEVFKDVSTVTRWLTKANRPLGGSTPLSLLDTEVGALEVDHELGRLEHGVLA